MLLVEDIAKDGDTDSQQSSGYVQLDCQYKIRGYYHSFSGAVLFQICYYNKKNGREPLNNQNIINQATDKMKLTGEHVSSFVDMEIYNLLPSQTKKNMGNIND